MTSCDGHMCPDSAKNKMRSHTSRGGRGVASCEMAEGCVDAQSLQDLFKEGWDVQKRIEEDDFDSTSDEFKV